MSPAGTSPHAHQTHTPHNAFQAAVAVSLGLCRIPFRAASKGNKQTKGMLENPLDSTERARDSAKTPGEKPAKKRQVNDACSMFPGG